jgi:hypothetical protein
MGIPIYGAQRTKTTIDVLTLRLIKKHTMQQHPLVWHRSNEAHSE